MHAAALEAVNLAAGMDTAPVHLALVMADLREELPMALIVLKTL